jgi:hypothetical protein
MNQLTDDHPNLSVRSKFTTTKDEMLRTLIEQCGEGNWHSIARHLPGRNARQYKERWFHYLAPNIVTAEWTEIEDRLLWLKVFEFGRSWKALSPFFPGRTEVSLKNRYNVLMRKTAGEIKAALGVPSTAFRRNSHFSRDTLPTVCNDFDEFAVFEKDDYTGW